MQFIEEGNEVTYFPVHVNFMFVLVYNSFDLMFRTALSFYFILYFMLLREVTVLNVLKKDQKKKEKKKMLVVYSISY